MVLKYCGDVHRHIHTKMEFLDISSLGAAYQYVVKIELKLKHKMQQFGSANPLLCSFCHKSEQKEVP
jgi:hypothetical protein